MNNSPRPALRSPVAISRFVLAVVLGIGLDLFTKAWAFAALQVELKPAGGHRWDVVSSQTYQFIPGFVHFHGTINYGAVFGLGQGKVWLFLIVSVLATVFLGYLFAISQRRQWFYQLVLGLLLAGVLGNMYDRIVHGYVRDMIYALPRWDIFPWIFNVADSLLCIGVVLMLVYTIFSPTPPDGAATTQNHDRSTNTI